MTVETVLERLDKLKKERESLQANLYAYEGAIQECQYWLEEAEKSRASGIPQFLPAQHDQKD